MRHVFMSHIIGSSGQQILYSFNSLEKNSKKCKLFIVEYWYINNNSDVNDFAK